MTAAPEPWSRRLHRFGRLVVAGSLAAAALALTVGGGDDVEREPDVDDTGSEIEPQT